MPPTPPPTNGLTPTSTQPHRSHPLHATLRTLPEAPVPLLHAPPPRFHRRHYITLDEEFENARNTSHHQPSNHTAHHQFPQALANVTTKPDPQQTEPDEPDETFGRAGMFRYGRAPYPRGRARRGEGESDASAAQMEHGHGAGENGTAAPQEGHQQQEGEEEDEGFEAWCRAHGLLRADLEEGGGGEEEGGV
ncbi:uncharacterized protein H6S33_010978 [Morchella sextelata]|uniref:uncharacterized protein n=1 Tax=Morchella sextelata TaxID=1174677 RepID=UPI001D04C695|nr:uncharacterized protein H6S33_010978 [Morchella sextelata]KAH0611713.1 hypothetical protein H6S33_010978 [Morchella sextelata]